MSLVRHSKRPRPGSKWRNIHTGVEAQIVRAGPAEQFHGEIRVLSTRDQQEPGTNNGWSIEAWNEHWEPTDV